MTEIQKDQKVTNNQSGQQNQNSQGSKSQSNDSSTTMVEDAQSDSSKEHSEDGHQHDSKTPVGEKTRDAENQSSTLTTGKAL
jgi:hypothetical protein